MLELGSKTKTKTPSVRQSEACLVGEWWKRRQSFLSLSLVRTLQMEDLDCFTVKEEVEEAFKREFEDLGDITLSLTPAALNSRQRLSQHLVFLSDYIKAKTLYSDRYERRRPG